jgi:hypothetical protein
MQIHLKMKNIQESFVMAVIANCRRDLNIGPQGTRKYIEII